MPVLEDADSTSQINILAEASEALRQQLGQCREIAGIYLAHALKGNQYGFPLDHDYVDRAIPMVRLTAELASTLARMKGEVRQRIVVEHIEAPAQPALIGEGRAASLSPPGGAAPKRAKRVVVDAAPDDTAC